MIGTSTWSFGRARERWDGDNGFDGAFCIRINELAPKRGGERHFVNEPEPARCQPAACLQRNLTDCNGFPAHLNVRLDEPVVPATSFGL